jgi:hypothetical protein
MMICSKTSGTTKMFKCLADKSNDGKIKHIEGVTMHKKIAILVVLLLTFTVGISSSLASSNEWDNPNVDWKSVQQSPQSFKGWEISTHEADLCSTLDKNEGVCHVIETLKEGDKISVLEQSKRKGYIDNHYKVKTEDGSIGWIDQLQAYIPLKNPKKYKVTDNDSLIRPITTSGLSKIKLTATFDKNKKKIELLKLAKNANLSYYNDSLHLLDENDTVGWRYESGFINVDNESDIIMITLYNQVDSKEEYNRVNKQSEIIMEYLLKPYFPKSYKQLAETYVKHDYKSADKLWKNGNYYKVDGRWLNFGFSLAFKPK